MLAGCGATVAVCDKLGDELHSVAATGAFGEDALVGVLDVRDAEAASAFVASVGQRWERIDVLVNNAGGGFHAQFLDVNAKGQRALVEENFTQVTTMIRAAVPLMTAGGSIVNVTSIEAHRAGPGFALYSAMKAAVTSLSKSLALELADRRIRVNCVAPDMIPTVGDADLVAASAAMAEESQGYVQPWPDGGTADDCAHAVLYLASDLSRFVTGSTIHVDGGTMAASGWRRSAEGTGWRL